MRLGKARNRKEVKMETLHFRLNGLSELLMHNPAGSMVAGGGPRLGRKTVPEPEEEAGASRYLLPDGNFYVPAVAVRNSILNGATGFRIGKRAAKLMLSAAIILLGETFPLTRNGNPIDGASYTIDIRRAVIKKNGIMRARAQIALPWQVECTYTYNSTWATLDQIKDIANSAGQIIGLLDYRPEKSGWFGRYEVEDIWSEKA